MPSSSSSSGEPTSAQRGEEPMTVADGTGDTMTGVGSELGVLAAWGSVTFLVAVRTFRWQ